MTTSLPRLASLALALSLAGCTDTASPGMTAPPGATHEITGTATFLAIDEAGGTMRFPIDLHDTLVSAQFAAGADWDVREGTSHADGTFAIEDAPDGDYWLEVTDVPSGARQFLWTNASALAFELSGLGRGDAVAAGPDTTLTFGPIDGLAAVRDDDLLQLASGNLGLSVNLFGALSFGTTRLQFTRAWTGEPLISAAKHDSIILSQLRTTTDATTGITYSAPIRSATFDTIEQQDGADTAITGTMTAPPILDYELAWNRSQFAGASRDIHPTLVGPVAAENFVLRAMPGGTAYGTSPFAPGVLAVDPSFFSGTSDLDQPIPIRNPFPASWLFNDFAMEFPVTLPVPGVAGASIQAGATIEVNTNELPTAGHPIVPLVTPPRQPRLAGLDLFADHDRVGFAPTLSWAPPAQGTPTAYLVTIHRWEVQVGQSDLAPVATLIVPGDVTSIRLPARLLEPGERYVLELTSLAFRGADVRTHSIYTMGLPFGRAELFGNTFSP